MKIFTVFAALIILAAHVNAQTKPIRLIIRGDDMGYAHAGNEALIKCSEKGIQTSIEVIVPSPWFPEAVAMLKKHPGIDVGVHLAITSEWDNIKWRPLTSCKSLTDADGYFLPMIWKNPNYPGLAISERSFSLKEIEQEFRAQIETAKRKLPNVTHYSSHMGCTSLNDSVKQMAKRLAEEYHINIDLESLQVKTAGYAGPHKTLTEKITSFIAMLDTLKPGVTYLFVDHPGLDSPELQAIHHIGYENVAEDRQGVTDLYTDEQVKAALKKRNIQSVSYGDLRMKK